MTDLEVLSCDFYVDDVPANGESIQSQHITEASPTVVRLISYSIMGESKAIDKESCICCKPTLHPRDCTMEPHCRRLTKTASSLVDNSSACSSL